jgi:dienelactone hydrolase
MLSLLLAAQIQVSPVSFPTKASDGVTLTGTLYEPQGLTARAPAVVVMHACDGLDPDIAAWANWFAEHGYVALAPDSFGPRHIDRVCGTPAVSVRTRAFDAFGALTYLRTLPNVDPGHIGVVGFSHGGGAVLWTENAQVASDAGFSQNGFAASVAFYPAACDQNEAKTLPDPLLILIGGSDDWTDARTCEQFVNGFDTSGAPGAIHVYPGVYHKFDDPSADRNVTVHKNVYTLRYDAQAAADAHDRVLAFFKQYL